MKSFDHGNVAKIITTKIFGRCPDHEAAAEDMEPQPQWEERGHDTELVEVTALVSGQVCR